MHATLIRSVLWLLILLSPSNVLGTFHQRGSRSNAVQPRAGVWAYVGCYTDSVGARTLTVNPGTTGGVAALTNQLCQSACQGLGYSIAGSEYAGECYCGNSFSNGGVLTTADGCNMACNGNATQICGGPNRLSVYDLDGFVSNLPKTTTTTTAAATTAATTATTSAQSNPTAIPGWTAIGCYVDNFARTLANQIFSIPGTSMTPSLCTAACQAGGYILAGVEYGGECYCDNSFQNGGGPAPDGNAGCNMPCNGNTALICGGSFRLNVFSYGTATTTTTTKAATTGSGTIKSATTTASTTTSASPLPTGLPTGWTYKGCWLDQQFGRILGSQTPDDAAMTIQSCVNACIGQGFTIAGMEYHTQCFCGNAMINQAVLATAESECNTPCGGNTNQICGGGDRMSIYSNQTTLKITPVAKIQKTGLPGSWNYVGCIYDDAVTRTFPYQLDWTTNNTAQTCLQRCADFGYGAGGMEFGEQCFCGDVSDVIAAGNQIKPDTDCNMVCTGNDTYLCGGPNRISYYNWTGSPLDLWDIKSGAPAGEYRYLIGGVTIPLIVTPAINGKITYMEKFGTSPNPNGTGAYELDLFFLNNVTSAWRAMHVKTDIFCAAGLTLPDKAGRQLNIGGWANDATFGMRFYWPDGSPGVPGVNDWQESPDVKMLDGRWYPTAMTMANGSILVLGGEEGSNGAPVPTLEVLPTPPGVTKSFFADWLQRTDPYNLYPYSVVLPGGNIFVAYYNEARIIDEVTLQTVKVLPNIPAAVNDFLGGRTYPFEGTAMVLPQYAPYTDPLTVIICGGTIPGPEIALDNCVTIQPTVATPKWTIERMPSKRVISCMVALPDGTYLINNGGQQGRAGFGLCTQPNLNAVLYDPSKPVHRRMSMMANTTVARLYHSESVLMDDGRVLVAGSDPEDVRFPQEYRNEVFLPPYITSGAARPAFTLPTASKNVAYGATFTITITAGTATKISLIAAVSSTHGNSMGQRTFFPAFSVAGSTVTITAMPDAHVAPPAWYQLFVLNGPTPSTAQWVRIGGDPAKLGNWPNHTGFSLPGI